MSPIIPGSIVAIIHNLDVISSADWIIDMGPDDGNKGGQIILEGTPKELLGAKQSLTSKYL
jgi:excinuclease UvrABC ATPase subunit